VMGLGRNLLTRLRLSQTPLGVENFTLKSKIFNFFPWGPRNLIWPGQKISGSKTGQPLIYCRSKVCLGQVRAHLYYHRLIMVITFISRLLLPCQGVPCWFSLWYPGMKNCCHSWGSNPQSYILVPALDH